MDNGIEHEIKYPLSNPEEVIALLENDNSFSKIEDTRQIDTYYTPIYNNFITKNPIIEWLRVRESDQGMSICYKNWGNEKSISCEEYETIVDNAEALKTILARLDFIILTTVIKHRQTWAYHDSKISIDDVENLGFYIEIEKKLKERNESLIKKELLHTLKLIKANVLEQEYQGYPMLLIKENNGLCNLSG